MLKSKQPIPKLTLAEKQQKVQELKAKKARIIGLPHLSSFKFYKWARTIWDSLDRMILLCAANQISKSSTMIRKNIELAGNKELWPKYWVLPPKQFWYLYPSKEVATVEFEQKWVKEFLPKGAYKEHEDYGWTAVYKSKYIQELKFNSGVSIYFKTYTQDVHKLQSSTVHMITVDEELPVNLFDELMFRLEAVNGIFMAAFTATMGQSFWMRAIEKIGTRHEVLKDALKLQISMYDCLEYEDGTATPWTIDKINKAKNKCSTKAQEQRRVYGRFVVDEGLIYKSFNSDRNCVTTKEFKKKNKIVTDALFPSNWEIYSAVDIGSGGENHPAAAVFIAVKPGYQYGAVFRGKRFDNTATLTSEDVLNGFRDLRGSLRCTSQSYDWAAIDFATIASRIGEPFIRANKSRTLGEDNVNVLFKNLMLDIIIDDDDEDELVKLCGELETLQIVTSKTKAEDDFCDALRYDVMSIPWDFTAIADEYQDVTKKKRCSVLSEIDQRRAAFDEPSSNDYIEIEEEISYMNDLYEG